LVSIYFQNNNDGVILYEKLTHLLGNQTETPFQEGVNVHYTTNTGLTISIDDHNPLSDIMKPTIVNIFTEHIIETKEEEWLLEIIEGTFYFKDEEEQDQIMLIAQSLLEGEKMDIPKIKHFPPREQLISEALVVLFKPNTSFSYESFLKFRLKSYFKQLLQYVELAIDEYKLEQDYQDFVHQLRHYVIGRVPLFSTIHVVHRTYFEMYNEHYYCLKEDEIDKLVEQSFKSKRVLNIDSEVIRGLISFAPRHIFVYSDDSDHGMIQTIQNVFQERVKLKPLKAFEQQRQKSEYL
jgi:putative sporulation protein YtxC